MLSCLLDLLHTDLAALTKVPAIRPFLAFDNKRSWFVARLRALKVWPFERQWRAMLALTFLGGNRASGVVCAASMSAVTTCSAIHSVNSA